MRTRKTAEETKKEIWEAIKLIESGKADKLENPECKKVNVTNICKQANVSRPTLYYYPEFKDYISQSNNNENIISKQKEEIKLLKEKLKDLRYYIKEVEKERDLALINQNNIFEFKRKK